MNSRLADRTARGFSEGVVEKFAESERLCREQYRKVFKSKAGRFVLSDLQQKFCSSSRHEDGMNGLKQCGFYQMLTYILERTGIFMEDKK